MHIVDANMSVVEHVCENGRIWVTKILCSNKANSPHEQPIGLLQLGFSAFVGTAAAMHMASAFPVPTPVILPLTQHSKGGDTNVWMNDLLT